MNKVTRKQRTKKLFCGNSLKLIIVADCAKEEHVVNIFNSSSGEFLYKKALVVKNSLKGFSYLLERVETSLSKYQLKPSNIDFVLEDPASYSQNFIYYLQKEGFNVNYVNAQQASYYRQNNRASSDTLDLDGIVRAALMGQVYKTNKANEVYTRLKECSRERARLIKAQSAHKNILINQVDQIFPRFLSQVKSGIQPFSKGCIELMLHKDFSAHLFLKASNKKLTRIISGAGLSQPPVIIEKLKALSAEILDINTFEPAVFQMRKERLISQLKMFKSRQDCIKLEEKYMAELLQQTPYALLTSIVGAGIVTISTIAGELGNIGNWRTIDQIASYAGVVPRQKQSGGSGKAPVVTSSPKAANRYLKNALMTIVDVARKNQHPSYRELSMVHPLKVHFDKVSLRNGSSYTSTAKKLIRIMMAILRQQTIYLPDIKTTTPQNYATWIEAGNNKMLQKWQLAGIIPTEDNYLGKWLKNKEALINAIIL